MARKRKRKRNKVKVPVASMGDIAFLLIIFFMICGEFSKNSVRVPLPRTADLEALKEASGAILVTVDEQGRIFINDTRVPDAEAVEFGVAAMIDGKADPMQRTVIFRCDRENSDRELYEGIIKALARSGARIALAGEKI